MKRTLSSDTFTIVGRCERTGMVGVALATSEIAVASRCPFAKARVGAVSTQAYTDPRLGELAIKLLDMGFTAPKVLQELISSDPYIERRQIGIVDKNGNTAVHTGKQNLAWAGHIAKKNFVAMGNYLVGEGVVKAMAEAFEKSIAENLEERLVRAIEAGRDAGGQISLGQHSAGIIVYDWEVFPRVNLRVDWHDEPIGELRRLLEMYKPLIPYYAQRPSDPTIGDAQEWLEQQKKARK